MKQCTKCKQEKELNLFATKSSSKDGKTSWCKACFAEHARISYQNGDRVRKERNRRKFYEANCEKLWQLMLKNPCVDCGELDPIVLEFDHRDNSGKLYNICEMLWSHSWANILLEIDKCDVRCANCHRRRTNKQFNMWRSLRA